MDPFRDLSVNAAIRADFGEHIRYEHRLIHEDTHRRVGPLLMGLSPIFGPLGRLRGRRDTPDALGLQPLLPPL